MTCILRQPWQTCAAKPHCLLPALPPPLPRRDFANGFLAAEIFSRYFKSEIAMHSFDNGAATSRKQDNWHQLHKFFTRMGFPISQQLLDDVMNSKPDAAVELIGAAYSILTQKPAPSRAHAESIDAPPAFARPTASQLVRDTLHSMGPTVPVDLKVKSDKTKSVVDAHNQQTRQEKINDPGRFQTKRSTTKLARIPVRSIGTAESEGPQIQFVKEVSVKRIDDNIAQLRASKSASATGGLSQRGGAEAGGAAAGAGGAGMAATGEFAVQGAMHAGGAPSSKPVIALLSASVLAALDGTPELMALLDPRSDGAVAFVDACAQVWRPD